MHLVISIMVQAQRLSHFSGVLTLLTADWPGAYPSPRSLSCLFLSFFPPLCVALLSCWCSLCSCSSLVPLPLPVLSPFWPACCFLPFCLTAPLPWFVSCLPAGALLSASTPLPLFPLGCNVSDSKAVMSQWSGDNWTLRARPKNDSDPQRCVPNDADESGTDPEIGAHGYKETIVQEYDGITVVHHQGRYQHITDQFHRWAFYEYRMRINGECWNIVVDEDMSNVPTSYPGSQSTKLTHDFCYLDSKARDEVYTKFSFVEMGGRTLWSFYLPDNVHEQLWIWVSPRRFVIIISNHPTNEKLNHFYSNKMHDHHILAVRTACWSMHGIGGDSAKKKQRSIVLSEQSR